MGCYGRDGIRYWGSVGQSARSMEHRAKKVKHYVCIAIGALTFEFCHLTLFSASM